MYANTTKNFEVRQLGIWKLTDCLCRVAQKNCHTTINQLPKQQKTTAVEFGPIVCIDQHITTSELSKNNCRKIKKQLPRQQKTTAEPAKNNCRKIKNNCRASKKQLPSKWAVGQLKFIIVCVSSSIKQLPKKHKTTAEATKNNCRPTKKQLSR